MSEPHIMGSIETFQVYRQNRPVDWHRENPHQRYRCDIILAYSDHHGVGRTEGEAIFNAGMAMHQYQMARLAKEN